MSELIRWRKVGGGSFRLKSGRIIKPNQVFTAIVEDIPQGFRDVVVNLSDLPEEKPLESETAFEVKETVEIADDKSIDISHEIESCGKGWYNVVNSATGKTINEKKLRKEDAESLLESLS